MTRCGGAIAVRHLAGRLDTAQRFTDGIPTDGAIRGALNAHCPSIIDKGSAFEHTSSSNNDDRPVGGRLILLPIRRAEYQH